MTTMTIRERTKDGYWIPTKRCELCLHFVGGRWDGSCKIAPPVYSHTGYTSNGCAHFKEEK